MLFGVYLFSLLSALMRHMRAHIYTGVTHVFRACWCLCLQIILTSITTDILVVVGRRCAMITFNGDIQTYSNA